ncbi:MAG: 2-amino-4-hydroxy-6-hydroxymethyldihydropteridine diphosphokinase [Caulobacter sp.]|nr:2-amino-4-hydroxy-6-hydroxymethyldihydropteridine diphosphokinase [Caulobacter sp.]
MKNTQVDSESAVLVAFGSNLPGRHGCCEDLLDAALDRFSDHGLTVVARSGWWQSAAWPDPAEPAYTNGVALVETALDPSALLVALQQIEQAFGRRRDLPNSARTLDLDLIAYGRLVREGPELVLPHPRAHLRRFVLGPIAELLPDWRHPTLTRTASELLVEATVGRDASPV